MDMAFCEVHFYIFIYKYTQKPCTSCKCWLFDGFLGRYSFEEIVKSKCRLSIKNKKHQQKMKQNLKKYEAPMMEKIECIVEHGFVLSGGNGHGGGSEDMGEDDPIIVR